MVPPFSPPPLPSTLQSPSTRLFMAYFVDIRPTRWWFPALFAYAATVRAVLVGTTAPPPTSSAAAAGSASIAGRVYTVAALQTNTSSSFISNMTITVNGSSSATTVNGTSSAPYFSFDGLPIGGETMGGGGIGRATVHSPLAWQTVAILILEAAMFFTLVAAAPYSTNLEMVVAGLCQFIFVVVSSVALFCNSGAEGVNCSEQLPGTGTAMAVLLMLAVLGRFVIMLVESYHCWKLRQGSKEQKKREGEQLEDGVGGGGGGGGNGGGKGGGVGGGGGGVEGEGPGGAGDGGTDSCPLTTHASFGHGKRPSINTDDVSEMSWAAGRQHGRGGSGGRHGGSVASNDSSVDSMVDNPVFVHNKD